MKLDSPLLELIEKCESLCMADCCGIDAYDFSPLHIASHLILHDGEIDSKQIRDLSSQLDTLSANYGLKGASASGVTIDDMNQVFSAKEFDKMINEIRFNLELAIEFIKSTKQRRQKNA